MIVEDISWLWTPVTANPDPTHHYGFCFAQVSHETTCVEHAPAFSENVGFPLQTRQPR